MSLLVCPKCKYHADENEQFCCKCGTKLVSVPERSFCSSCGAELKQAAKFCSQCGAETEKSQKKENYLYSCKEDKQSKNINKDQVYDSESIKKIAYYHKTFLVYVLLNLLIIFLWRIFERSEYGYILNVFAIPILIASILFVTFPAIAALIYLRNELKGNIILTVIISIFLFIPVINILFAAGIISRGSKVLKAASYKVGSLGLPWKDVKTLVNDGSNFMEKQLHAARVYYLITFALVVVSCFINYLYLDKIYYYVANDYLEEGKKDSELYLSSSADSKYKTAVLLYEKAAEKGNALAQYELGMCYESGIGIKKGRNEAAKWFRKAAEQGQVDAQYELGMFYLSSWMAGVMVDNGVKHADDVIEATKWFRKAAEQGHAGAQFTLGACYEQGAGIQQDKTEAVKWYTLAEENGFEEAKEALKRLGY